MSEAATIMSLLRNDYMLAIITVVSPLQHRVFATQVKLHFYQQSTVYRAVVIQEIVSPLF
jgi:hypothetical protein